MPGVAAFVRGWFTEPPPTFELRQPSARWGQAQPRHARHALRVAEVIDETPSTRTFVLAAPDGGTPRLAYRAGQHLTLLVDAGRRHAPPLLLVLDLAARRRPAGDHGQAHARTGIVSRHLHDRVRAGDTLVGARARPATSRSTTDPASPRHIVLVAGGVGITPLMSMAETVLRAEPGSRVTLLCGNRSEQEIVFRAAPRALAARVPRRVSWCGTRSTIAPGRLDGPARRARRRAGAAGARGRAADAYYVCGPEPMMQSVCAALAAAGRAARAHPHRAVRLRLGGHDAHPGPRRGDHFRRAAAGASPRAPGQTILQAGLEAGRRPALQLHDGRLRRLQGAQARGHASS